MIKHLAIKLIQKQLHANWDKLKSTTFNLQAVIIL